MATPASDPPFGLAWRHPLPPWQQEGVRRLTQGSLLLADDMGLGKTIQAIGALRVLGPAAVPALVVAPAGLVLQWRAQFCDWAPELRLATALGTAAERMQAWRREADVHLTSYDSLRSDILLRDPCGPARRDWAVVVADEAQRMKNPRAETAIAVKRLRARRAWALTGTPLENSADDIASILDFVAPGGGHRREMMVGLRRLLAAVLLRRRRGEVLRTLPPKSGITIDPGLTPAQRAAYDVAEREGLIWLRSLGTRVRITEVLELLLRLKQICNAAPQSGASGKLDDLERRIAAVVAAGEKALVFSQFVQAPFGVAAIAERLHRFAPLCLIGGQDPAERAAILRRFGEDPKSPVLVLSLRAGGVGLNLTAASAVFHFDRWWTAAVEAQAEDRAHRMGQRRAVRVVTYRCRDTVEERIADIIAHKQALFDLHVEGDGAEALARLELADLLRAVGV
ncbi:MAG: DEAD/DEAH box helicase [Acetobacteraceae bacterium]|nr:DEAD/DEAH box helicase [Acetobacteraceae bacterium]